MGTQMASCSGTSVQGQVVLVLQGGGALGAYQVGVYQALHEAGFEPDWVIGTSIGAINAALIAGNRLDTRLARLDRFWDKVRVHWPRGWQADFAATMGGVPAFFAPRAIGWGGIYAPLGVYASSLYRADDLQQTLDNLLDPELFGLRAPRLTVGAVEVTSGELEYFDTTKSALRLEHVMASGALPPAFAAVAVDGKPYWDGGIYSNTPIEAVMDDQPRRDSVIFNVNVWHPQGPAPQSIWQVLGRQKNIQYSSRVESHIARQKQLHRMRHIIRQLKHRLPPEARDDPSLVDLTSHGCGTTMHVVRLLAPEHDGDDYTKDLDFTAAGIASRRNAGYDDARAMLAARPWLAPVNPMEGVIIHQNAPMTERLAKS